MAGILSYLNIFFYEFQDKVKKPNSAAIRLKNFPRCENEFAAHPGEYPVLPVEPEKKSAGQPAKGRVKRFYEAESRTGSCGLEGFEAYLLLRLAVEPHPPPRRCLRPSAIPLG
ncbi:MAG: hypothetical protein A3F83_12580 [Candidatus Glassbacteria bacterium RIFCSPLOWO2_12_FULL_58_11]|uniref:Uncharacterized protein n=1 Tax=Candidatus Glassbacteria bacterium RIFCSPLOWO2_12_FULL_58_11 TaxID=1817867 RepID=A0A1F5Z0U0_9BACT|nr:MAG: hypothetical protein A3F83_12580 [Candidatus Glassbacteria bacterium RIFCSPLOWO2_12_FULL_58_11]